MPNRKVTGCLPQSVYKDSTKNKTIKATIAWMIDKINGYHGCTTGDCPHETQQECVDAMHEQFTESNVPDHLRESNEGENDVHTENVQSGK